jgi:hypothetical protein
MFESAKEAFKVGFLTRCAEEGLVGDALAARLARVVEFNEKTADISLTDIATAAGLGAAVPIGAAALGGGALGYGAAKLTAPTLDENELKAQEIINTYKVMAAKARAKHKLREYRTAR